MSLLQKISTKSTRLSQFMGGAGNNNFARATDVNPVIDYINNRSSDTIALNAATCSSNAATLNAISGTITTEALTTAADARISLNITNSYCTTSSVVVAVITGGTQTGGTPIVYKCVPSSGSFRVYIANVGTAAVDGTIIINFIIL